MFGISTRLSLAGDSSSLSRALHCAAFSNVIRSSSSDVTGTNPTRTRGSICHRRSMRRGRGWLPTTQVSSVTRRGLPIRSLRIWTRPAGSGFSGRRLHWTSWTQPVVTLRRWRAERSGLPQRRLIHGPWQAFERDVGRLLVANGFDDVRIVGGSGDKGADVLGVRHGELWVWQVKHTTTSPPPRDAIGEVVNAAKYYGAQKLLVAVSRPPSDAFWNEKARYERMGL